MPCASPVRDYMVQRVPCQWAVPSVRWGRPERLAINPAGIGVYRSSEVVGTFNLSNNQSVVGDQTANKTRFNMDNLGFVGYFPLRNDMMPVVNFGFSYNKLQSFDRNVSAIGTAKGTLIDYIAKNSAGIDPSTWRWETISRSIFE